MTSSSPLTFETITRRTQSRAKELVAQARRELAELTNAPDAVKYDAVRDPLSECAALLEQIVSELKSESEITEKSAHD